MKMIVVPVAEDHRRAMHEAEILHCRRVGSGVAQHARAEVDIGAHIAAAIDQRRGAALSDIENYDAFDRNGWQHRPKRAALRQVFVQPRGADQAVARRGGQRLCLHRHRSPLALDALIEQAGPVRVGAEPQFDPVAARLPRGQPVPCLARRARVLGKLRGIDLECVDRQMLDQGSVAADGVREAERGRAVEGVGVYRIEKLARVGRKADRQGIEPRRCFRVE